jgi:RNA polymerase sigma factor (sigma-70 family)
MVAVPVTGLSDEELAEAAAAGDQRAFADLRQRYAGAVYDLLARMTRSRADAAALTRVTFERARRGLSDRPEGRLRPWLYAIARQAAIDAIRRRQEISVADGAAMAGLEDSEAENQALVDDVWQAAAALRPEEYAALHYRLRAGLDTEEIAEAMSLPAEAVQSTLSRAREGLDDAFALLQLARRDRRACGGLELLVGFHAPTPLDPATRRAFRRHLEGCAKCRHRHAQLVAPSGVLSALLPVAPPKYLRIAHNARPLPEVQPRPSRRGRHVNWATPAVALAVFALAVLFLVSRGPRPDRTPPAEPQVMSTTHVPWVANSHRSVEVLWAGAADRAAKGERDSGVAGYSVSWSGQPGDVPAGRVETSGERSASPELAEGVWWFHLRAVDKAGNATPPVHYGPFVIAEPPPSPTPAPAPSVRRPSSPRQRPGQPQGL